MESRMDAAVVAVAALDPPEKVSKGELHDVAYLRQVTNTGLLLPVVNSITKTIISILFSSKYFTPFFLISWATWIIMLVQLN
jgi:hypothetical protein